MSNYENFKYDLKNEDLQNQIFLMLKGVGAIEENEIEFKENLNELKENLFGDDDFFIFFFDDAETNHNTTISQKTFLRTQNEKSLTIKHNNNMIFNNCKEFRRDKKFPTQNYFSNYSFPFIENNTNNLKDNYYFQLQNNYLIYSNNCNYLHPINKNFYNCNNKVNNNTNINNSNTLNNGNLTSSLGIKMPIRTYNFITKPQNINNKKHDICGLREKNFNQTQNIFFNKNQKLKKDKRNNKIINENISKDLELLLIQNISFNTEIFNKLKDKFIPLLKIQQTSRILQLYLENTPLNIIHSIFLEIKDQIVDLLFDIYANYFCLKIFYYLNDEDRLIYLNNIQHHLDNLCINKISTYPIQCIIEKIMNEKEQEIIFNGIKNNLMKISIDVYGTHVLEKIISSFNYEKFLIHISNFILENFLLLVNNSNGLCIVKQLILLEYKRKKEKNFQILKKLLIENSLILIQNPFGNYALQIAIDNWEIEDLKEIIFSFKGKYLILSIQKYSSNVIERCIEKSEEFLYDFIYSISNDNNSIGLLIKNNYGNYVIQTAFKASKNNKQIQNIIINIINNNLVILNDKKLINKWKSIISNIN